MQVFTDALFPEFSEEIEERLLGLPFDIPAIKKALSESEKPELLELSQCDFSID